MQITAVSRIEHAAKNSGTKAGASGKKLGIKMLSIVRRKVF